MYLVFTRMPGESYRKRLRSLLYSCYAFRAIIVVVVDRFYIALFSALEQTHCTRM